MSEFKVGWLSFWRAFWCDSPWRWWGFMLAFITLATVMDITTAIAKAIFQAVTR